MARPVRAAPASRRSRGGNLVLRLRPRHAAHAVHGIVVRGAAALDVRSHERRHRASHGACASHRARGSGARSVRHPGVASRAACRAAPSPDPAGPALRVSHLRDGGARGAAGVPRAGDPPMTQPAGDAWSLASAALSLGVLLAAAPVVPGVAARTRAMLTGRRGQPVWQLYSDLWKLARKGAVYSTATTWAFRLAPVALLVTTVLACAFVPLDGRRSLIAFTGDAVAFAYLLGLGRFLLVLGAMDTGSSFEGMGASREVSFATLVEPGLFVTLAALAIATQQLSLAGMIGPALWQRWTLVAPSMILFAASLFVLMLAETARVPVDDTTTHLELTMIH